MLIYCNIYPNVITNTDNTTLYNMNHKHTSLPTQHVAEFKSLIQCSCLLTCSVTVIIALTVISIYIQHQIYRRKYFCSMYKSKDSFPFLLTWLNFMHTNAEAVPSQGDCEKHKHSRKFNSCLHVNIMTTRDSYYFYVCFMLTKPYKSNGLIHAELTQAAKLTRTHAS